MKIYVIQEWSVVATETFTSLRGACEAHGISYSAASKGKRSFLIRGTFFHITECEVIKIKGRENNYKKKVKL